MSTDKKQNQAEHPGESDIFRQEAVESNAAEFEGVNEQQLSMEANDTDSFSGPEQIIEKLESDLAKARDEALRTQAEMQNLRRRTERDVENAHKYALEKFVGELLPVVDNLERALQSIDKDNKELTALVEGVELTLKGFLDVLVRYKVEAINPVGELFDPEFHQAMSMLEMPEKLPNTVVDVFQKGYRLNGRLVRPAMVVVAKAPS